ncbi:S46 family peptidase [Carboxylicivirga sp. M1479]|uniref:S46 family peptidase n=1 Tax=Carboxylicivirga sp. M1479 TaxID=2594476 RepID=UPI0011789B3E|nr:S46 family peptidase [Carboxylicivirga sp. M1479]TRX62364.1 S46 family peptidase [Carboxylicivirga sp. M1479]
MRLLLITIIGLWISIAVKADEGMWLPYLFNQQQIEQMQQKGLQIPFESIYNHSAPSLKDAVVSLDDGSCTGEFISEQGLLLTNHHCGYSDIQQLSAVEHNYLEHGFWAASKDEELPSKGKTATLLLEAHDVTSQLMPFVEKLKGLERQVAIDSLITIIETDASKDSPHDARVKSFFNNNVYILFITQTYSDVRLVGTPPSSIGKFGGDTDNWMWPRHTGDFCFFRVYSAPDGSPAEYSPDNIPFTPKKHFTINTQGINNGDFTMTLGYPGQTQRYLTSFGVNEINTIINPIVSEVRGIKQAIWEEAMHNSEEISIMYAAKHSESSNYWKYAIGQNKALDKLNIISDHQQREENFISWLQQDSARIKTYDKALPVVEASYMLGSKLTLAETITQETMLEGADIIKLALDISSLFMDLQNKDKNDYEQELVLTREAIKALYKDYDAQLDQEVFTAMLQYYLQNTPESLRPPNEALLGKKHQDKPAQFSKALFENSALTNKEQAISLLESTNESELFEDPAIAFSYQILSHLYQILDIHDKLNRQLGDAQRILTQGYLEKDKVKTHYPDANSTMRLSFGSVDDYEPKDGVRYTHQTTLSGIMEKEDNESKDFRIPNKLKDLYETKDFGNYALSSGKMPVCFITNNDITGGNSGSPVINANGELVGVAFDGNWEAMTSDLAYEPQLQKCICVDIRYVLFIVDKMANAQHLIDEIQLAD